MIVSPEILLDPTEYRRIERDAAATMEPQGEQALLNIRKTA
jgi:hypothetical protein